MRVVLLLALVVLNLGVRWASRDWLRERESLEREIVRTRADAERLGEDSRQRGTLASVERAFGELRGGLRMSEPLGVTSLRESLLEAEAGLELDRLSLDFRPLTSGTSGATGSRVGLSSSGGFHALVTYLGRIESSALPLVPEELRLRRDTSGRTLLDARWSSVWKVPGPGEVTSAELADVEAWLASERGLPVEDDFFADDDARGPFPAPAPPVETRASGLEPPGIEHEDVDIDIEVAVPSLTGFVMARPELEPDVDRRVLAALRFDGAIHLVTVGGRLGGYELVALSPRESVTLVDDATGERLLLRLP